MRLAIIAACVAVIPAASAHADPFTVLPNGELVFNARVTTQGVFNCAPTIVCDGEGTSSVTVFSGGNSTTLTFTGVVDKAFQVGNTATPVDLAQIDAVPAGPGFVFPTRPNPNVPIVNLHFTIMPSSPVPGARGLFWTFGPGGGANLPMLRGFTYVSFPAGPNPPGFEYTQLVYTISPFPFSLPGNGSTTISANVGAVPEPATLVLVGTGLAAAVGARRRRRRVDQATISARFR